VPEPGGVDAPADLPPPQLQGMLTDNKREKTTSRIHINFK